LIATLANHLGDETSHEIERLQTIPNITHWKPELQAALHDHRIARRKAMFQQPSIDAICRSLNNLQPANAADLSAMTLAHLEEIGRRIRDDSTNDYRQYWSFDENNKKLSLSKPENDCRDALLSDLKEPLGKLGVDAIREGNYADDKRADIRVSFGGSHRFNVPVEIKKDSHKDLWRSIHEQLIPKYTRDPGADGYGIYLVFWFGGKDMPIPPDGKKVRTPVALKEHLQQQLSSEECRHISICVVDCSLP